MPTPSEKHPPANHSLIIADRWQALTGILAGQGARQGYLAAIDQGVISISNFAATIILARQVSPTELGVYGVGFIALRLARAVQEGLTIQPLNVFGAALDEDDFRRYATTTSWLQVGLAVLSAAAVWLCGWLLTVLGNDTAGPTLTALWSAFLWWQIQEYLRRMLYTRGQIGQAVLNTCLANAVRLCLMVAWIYQGQLSGATGLTAIAWGAFFAMIPGIWFTRQYWTRHPLGLREVIQRNWNFGGWVMGGALANWVAIEFYPILTAGMISFAAAGAYRALQNLVAPIHMLLRAVDTFLTPRAARAYSQRGMPALGRLVRLTYLFTGLPIVGLLTLALLYPRQLLSLLYGDTYLAFSDGMLLMVAFYALVACYWPLQAAIKAVRQSRPLFLANLAATLAMFTAGVWAILQWGVYGTIAGQALNALIVNLVLWLAWLQLPRSPSKDRQPGRDS